MRKMICVVCKKDLVYYRMVLMIGPMGYRRYALCEKCAAKVERKQMLEKASATHVADIADSGRKPLRLKAGV